MKILKISLLSVLALLLLFFFGHRVLKQKNNQTANIERNILQKKAGRISGVEANEKQEFDAEKVIRASEEEYKESLKTCKDKDREANCKKICKNIYNRIDREKCEELAIAQIERLKQLHELLGDFNEEELKTIELDDFDLYLSISIEPLEDLVMSELRKSSAKIFLTWLIENPNFFAKFKDADEDFQVLNNLLKRLYNFEDDGSDIHSVFTAKLDRVDNLMETIIQVGDEEIMAWFLDYINEKNESCANNDKVNCFKVYCKIGNNLNYDNRNIWLSFESFEEYIEDIILNGINRDTNDNTKPYEWGNREIEKLVDTNNWFKDLCKEGATDLTL